MIVRRLLYPALALAVASVACQPAAQQPAGLSADDAAAIKGTLDAVIEGELAGDWDAVGAIFAEDAAFMMPNAPALEGRAAWMQFVKAAGFVITDLTVDVADIDGRGDLAFVRGVYSEVMSMGGAEPTAVEGKWIWILRKQADGEWKVVVTMSNSNLPVEET